MTESALAKLQMQGMLGAKIAGDTFISCYQSPAILTMPGGVTKLADFCLSGQDSLVEVRLINGIKSIGLAPFANCSKLKRIVCTEDLRLFEYRLRYSNNAELVYRKG